MKKPEVKPYSQCQLTKENIIYFIDIIKTDRLKLKNEVKELITRKENISEIYEELKSTIDKQSNQFFSFFNNSRLRKDLNLLSIGLKSVLEGEHEEKCKFEEREKQQQCLKDDKEIDSIIHDILVKTESALKLETLASIASKFGNTIKICRESQSSQFCQLIELRFSQFLRFGCTILKLNDEDMGNIMSLVEFFNLNHSFKKISFGFDLSREQILTELCEQIGNLFPQADSYNPDQRGKIVIGKMVENILKKEKELVDEDTNWLLRKTIILCNVPKYTDIQDLTEIIISLRISSEKLPAMTFNS